MQHAKLITKCSYGVHHYTKSGESLSGMDVNLVSITRWLMVRDIGHVERGAAQLELQQREMKSCKKLMVIIILKCISRLSYQFG